MPTTKPCCRADIFVCRVAFETTSSCALQRACSAAQHTYILLLICWRCTDTDYSNSTCWESTPLSSSFHEPCSATLFALCRQKSLISAFQQLYSAAPAGLCSCTLTMAFQQVCSAASAAICSCTLRLDGCRVGQQQHIPEQRACQQHS